MTTVLSLDGVRAAYGAVEVLHGVDLEVEAGSVVAILGPNGAGKTTLLNTVAGLHPIAGGAVHVVGRRVNGATADQLARAGVCLVPEGRGVFPNLTVVEHLRLVSHRGRSLAEIESEAYARFPRLAERRTQVAGTLSGGEQQMLSLARSLAAQPAILLLDELSMGLAPLIVSTLYEQVAMLAAEGISVVVVEQFAQAVLGVADRAGVLVHGQLSPLMAPHEIEGRLSSAYLGTNAATTTD